jgi:hypothetical protein
VKKSFLFTSTLALTFLSAGQAMAMEVAPEAIVYETETNETYGTATRFAIGDTVYGRMYQNIGFSTDVDMFSFSNYLSGTTKVTLTNIPLGYDYDLYLYDQYYNLVGSSMNRGSTAETISKPLGLAKYFVKVVSYSGYSPNYYNLKATVQ